ncbi:RNA-directed DNA polymerase, eukaryota, Nucleotide-binding alpha-beta plait domain protein [Artemisia annua]|uniref:RNA-directed DNA polymerase, eukaryota, Nucleotide-binding alpha-beta plait domain protein n=1 Tax=Artemisia annua TaxID=35608 RepID=A0A2U1NVE3_ARTAN|nr:RNA-directed DNA polymerase, eukaryota, Nucleotide-binding alpha-beta plait domain protein [Artemisia annua]
MAKRTTMKSTKTTMVKDCCLIMVLKRNVAAQNPHRKGAVKTPRAGVKVDNLVGNNVRYASTPSYARGSFASVLNNGNQSSAPLEKSGPALVLDDSCLTDNGYSMALMGKVKDVAAIPNLKFTLAKEGFLNIELTYLGGLWVLLEFQSVTSKEKFSKHTGVYSWFSSLKPASSSFVSDERIVWISIEGLPLSTRTKNTFSKIALKWGDLIDWKGYTEKSLSYKRLCIKTKFEEIINEKFKIIVKGKVYWIRAKEMEAWEPNFLSDEFDNLSSDGELFGEDDGKIGTNEDNGHEQCDVSDVERVSESSFTPGDDIVQDNILNKNTPVETIHSDDPFNIYEILNKKVDKDNHVSEDLPFPPGFTPVENAGGKNLDDTSEEVNKYRKQVVLF